MIYTELTEKAMRLAYAAHHGQVDRGGLPYIHHPMHLAEQMTTEDECVVALLHDTIEDTPLTMEDLEAEGFTAVQLEAVRLLTRVPPKGNLSEQEKLEDYFRYIEALKDNPIARAVKLADLEHNSDRTRATSLSEHDEMRYQKYERAKEILNS